MCYSGRPTQLRDSGTQQSPTTPNPARRFSACSLTNASFLSSIIMFNELTDDDVLERSAYLTSLKRKRLAPSRLAELLKAVRRRPAHTLLTARAATDFDPLRRRPKAPNHLLNLRWASAVARTCLSLPLVVAGATPDFGFIRPHPSASQPGRAPLWRIQR
jgi:hypothetical protein